MFDLEGLEERLKAYVQATLGLSEIAASLPIDVLRRGELQRGEAARITGRSERTARSLLASLVENGLLVSDTVKGPVRLHFSAESADVLFPRLFAAQLGV
jgi:Fic family protein